MIWEPRSTRFESDMYFFLYLPGGTRFWIFRKTYWQNHDFRHKKEQINDLVIGFPLQMLPSGSQRLTFCEVFKERTLSSNLRHAIWDTLFHVGCVYRDHLALVESNKLFKKKLYLKNKKKVKVLLFALTRINEKASSSKAAPLSNCPTLVGYSDATEWVLWFYLSTDKRVGLCAAVFDEKDSVSR